MSQEYAATARENERLLQQATEWLFADAEFRTRHKSHGRQVIEVSWHDGVVESVLLSQSNNLKRNRRSLTPAPGVLTPDEDKVN
jgi:hypothetical protein